MIFMVRFSANKCQY